MFVIGSLAFASTALAQPRDEEPQTLDRRDRSALSVTVGAFTPTGTLGVEYAHAVHPKVELAVGAGIGYLAASLIDDDYRVRPEVAVMPRWRTRVGALRVALGAGVSAGSYQDTPSPFAGEEWREEATLAMWANAEGGVQLVSRSGWFAGARLGVGYLFAHSKVRSDDTTRMPTDPSGTTMPYLGMTFGRTL